jgi:hypothetical protein
MTDKKPAAYVVVRRQIDEVDAPDKLYALLHKLSAANNPDGVLAVKDRAIELGHCVVLEQAVAVHDGLTNKYDPNKMAPKQLDQRVSNLITDEERLSTLKGAIKTGKGTIYQPKTCAGSLYRTLFFDETLDGALLGFLNGEEQISLQNAVKDHVLRAPSVEQGDEMLGNYFKNLVRHVIAIDVEGGGIRVGIYDLAKAVDEIPFLQESYEPVITFAGKNGMFKEARIIQSITEGKGMPKEEPVEVPAK